MFNKIRSSFGSFLSHINSGQRCYLFILIALLLDACVVLVGNMLFGYISSFPKPASPAVLSDGNSSSTVPSRSVPYSESKDDQGSVSPKGDRSVSTADVTYTQNVSPSHPTSSKHEVSSTSSGAVSKDHSSFYSKDIDAYSVNGADDSIADSMSSLDDEIDSDDSPLYGAQSGSHSDKYSYSSTVDFNNVTRGDSSLIAFDVLQEPDPNYVPSLADQFSVNYLDDDEEETYTDHNYNDISQYDAFSNSEQSGSYLGAGGYSSKDDNSTQAMADIDPPAKLFAEAQSPYIADYLSSFARLNHSLELLASDNDANYGEVLSSIKNFRQNLATTKSQAEAAKEAYKEAVFAQPIGRCIDFYNTLDDGLAVMEDFSQTANHAHQEDEPLNGDQGELLVQDKLMSVKNCATELQDLSQKIYIDMVTANANYGTAYGQEGLTQTEELDPSNNVGSEQVTFPVE